MPVPKTTDVGKLKTWFKKDKPKWKDSQVTAAALETARRNGANIKAPPKTKRKVKRSKR